MRGSTTSRCIYAVVASLTLLLVHAGPNDCPNSSPGDCYHCVTPGGMCFRSEHGLIGSFSNAGSNWQNCRQACFNQNSPECTVWTQNGGTCFLKSGSINSHCGDGFSVVGNRHGKIGSNCPPPVTCSPGPNVPGSANAASVCSGTLAGQSCNLADGWTCQLPGQTRVGSATCLSSGSWSYGNPSIACVNPSAPGTVAHPAGRAQTLLVEASNSSVVFGASGADSVSIGIDNGDGALIIASKLYVQGVDIVGELQALWSISPGGSLPTVAVAPVDSPRAVELEGEEASIFWDSSGDPEIARIAGLGGALSVNVPLRVNGVDLVEWLTQARGSAPPTIGAAAHPAAAAKNIKLGGSSAMALSSVLGVEIAVSDSGNELSVSSPRLIVAQVDVLAALGTFVDE